jgi:hypothetical protein
MQNTKPTNTDRIIVFLMTLAVLVIVVVRGINAQRKNSHLQQELQEMPIRAAQEAYR